MTQKGNVIEISAICLIFILLSLGGIVWDFASGLLLSGIDGIMLLFVALMVALVFGLMWLYTLQQAGMLPQRKKADAKTVQPAAATAAPAKPAAAPAATAPASPKPLPAPAQTTAPEK